MELISVFTKMHGPVTHIYAQNAPPRNDEMKVVTSSKLLATFWTATARKDCLSSGK
jgi:hypothetical protein